MHVISIFIVAGFGLFVSLYATLVEWRSMRDKKYVPICDVSKNISCTKAFLSPYGKLFKASNAQIGIGLYLVILALAYLGNFRAVFGLSLLAVATSFYLAYLLYYKVKSFCIVCSSVYMTNFILAVISYMMMAN